MKCVICGQPIEEGRRQGQPPLLAKYCLKCREERRRRARVTYTWLPERDAYLKAHYFGRLNRRFQVLSSMVRMTGLPRWYIKLCTLGFPGLPIGPTQGRYRRLAPVRQFLASATPRRAAEYSR